MLSPEEGRKPVAHSLRGGLTYLCWLFLGVTSLAAAFFTALYSLELTREQATSWVMSVMLSMLHNLVISQPVKVRENGASRGGGGPLALQAAHLGR